jgi:hypothetical protein
LDVWVQPCSELVVRQAFKAHCSLLLCLPHHCLAHCSLSPRRALYAMDSAGCPTTNCHARFDTHFACHGCHGCQPLSRR